jgi:hypothetical protein
MSNFSCPECGVTQRHASRSCGCGWGKSGSRRDSDGPAPINAEQYAARMQTEAAFSAECRKWLDDHRITTPSMTQATRIKAMAQYRTMLKNTMRRADSAPRDWANSLKSDYLDGVVLLPIQIQMASEALGESWENRQCKQKVAA